MRDSSHCHARPVLAVPAMMALGLLAAALVFAPSCPAPAEGQEAGDGEPIEAWQELWEQIEAQGYEGLSPEEADNPSLRAAGDTCGMRYRSLFDDLDRDVKHAFQVAAFSNDPATKLELLSTITATSQGVVRQRALLETARVRLRQGDVPGALEDLAKARQISGPAACRADLVFLEGYIHGEADDFHHSLIRLQEAVELDPGFWNARQQLVTALTRRLTTPGLSAGACLETTRLLIENLAVLPQLAQDVKQFRTIADHLAAAAPVGNGATALVAGLGYQWGGDPVQAKALFEQGQQSRGSLPGHCERLVQERLDRALAP